MREIDPAIKAYIENYDVGVQKRLLLIRDIIFSLMPAAEETIKYQMPTVVYHGNLIHYAAFTNHIGIYPLPKVIEALKEELKVYKQGKGSIQFQNNEEFPIEVIKKIVKTRVEEKEIEINAKKAKANKGSIAIPEELKRVLGEDAEAKDFFEKLSDGYKRGYCDWVGGAKQAATREVRAGKALSMLRNKQKTLKT